MRHVKAFAAIVITFTVIDLIWLGIVAQGVYDDLLGPLKAKEIGYVVAIQPAACNVYIVDCMDAPHVLCEGMDSWRLPP